MSEVATSPADFSNISLIGRRVLREMTRPYSLNLGQEMGESIYAPNATDDFVADTKNAQDWNILGSLASIRYGACDLTPAAAMPNPRMELAYKGGRIRAVATMKFPRVMVFEGLVTAEECERLIEAAKPRLMRSEVAGPDPDVTKGIVDDARTSFGTSLPKEEFKLIETIDRRLSKLLRWPIEKSEPLHMLRYFPGAEYKPHHDYFPPEFSGSGPHIKRGGNRIGTLIIYLNDCKSAGHTIFPDLGLEVMPRRGNGVFFSYDRPHPSTLSLHGGMPVGSGEKWIATRWLKERELGPGTNDDA